jgi:hypothetical protein
MVWGMPDSCLSGEVLVSISIAALLLMPHYNSLGGPMSSIPSFPSLVLVAGSCD